LLITRLKSTIQISFSLAIQLLTITEVSAKNLNGLLFASVVGTLLLKDKIIHPVTVVPNGSIVIDLLESIATTATLLSNNVQTLS